MSILDSNVWISYFNEEDLNHRKAREIVRKQEQIILPEYVVIEVVTVIAQKLGKQIADSVLTHLTKNQNISLLFATEQFFLDSLDFYLKKSSKKLSFIDYSLLHLSRSYHIITFDKALKQEIKKI